MTAQTGRFSFGVQGGVPAEIPLLQTDNRRPFVIGPTVNIGILPRLSIDTGVLYHRLGQNSNLGVFLYPENSVTLGSSSNRAHALELPVLARYSILGGARLLPPVQPCAEPPSTLSTHPAF